MNKIEELTSRVRQLEYRLNCLLNVFNEEVLQNDAGDYGILSPEMEDQKAAEDREMEEQGLE